MGKASDFTANTTRFYKVKNPRKQFLCALCRAPRQMKYSKNLSVKNYLQLFILSSFISWATFPLMGFKGLFWVFVVWPVAELANKLIYRKEIPCPYCGFDATWYRRDVKVARRKVEDFWSSNYPELVGKKREMSHALGGTELQGSKDANSPQANEILN